MSCNPCDDVVVSQVPGPAGANGADGAAGTNGVNSYTALTAQFTMPALAASGVADVGTSAWASVGQVVYLQNAGWLRIAAKPSATQLTLTNIETATEYTENVAAATIVPVASTISPGGLQGPSGATPGASLDSISPTTTRGDLIVDNGANNPLASTIRVGVGTNGQLLAANSAQPSGVQWRTPLPVSGVSDNGIPRFDGTSGTPVPLQASNLLITDDGAVQSTPTGGNARGSRAVDLQTFRSAATQVASGDTSVISGGRENTSSANRSVVGGGTGNTASGNLSTVSGGVGNTASADDTAIGGGSTNVASTIGATVAGGSNNTASGQESAIGGGTQNAASGGSSVISGGDQNTASTSWSTVPGGFQNVSSGAAAMCHGLNASASKYGQYSHASGMFSATGDAQFSRLVCRNTTTNATPTDLYLDGGTLPQRLSIPVNTSWALRGQVIGRIPATGANHIWHIDAGCKNNGGTCTLIGAAVVTSFVNDAGFAGGAVAITIDGANDSLLITVTGVAATTIKWSCYIEIAEVAG